MKKWHFKLRVFAVVLSLLLVLPGNILISAAAVSTTTKVKHKPPKKKYIPGFRINLNAKIKDKAGILLARCYFKTKKDNNFGFVPMFHGEGPDYSATLPAPWLNSEAVEYLIVAINKEKAVTRTQIFVIEEEETEEAKTWKEAGDVKEIRLDKVQEAVEDYKFIKQQLREKYLKKLPKHQTGISNDPIAVNTELDKSQVDLSGFNDNATVTEVPGNMKYGFLAEDLYTPAQIAAAGGTSSVSATTGGTIIATGGMSTGAIVGAVVGVGVLAGGAAAISSSTSEDDDDQVGRCNTQTTAGQDTPETHTFEMGQSAGTFRFDYETFGQEDRMLVIYQGGVLFDTGCLGTGGTRTVNITYAGASTQVTVQVIPNCAGGTGTAWNFTVFCPF